MKENFSSRLKNAWNTFMNKDPTVIYSQSGYSYSARQDRVFVPRFGDKSIVTSLYNRIAMDVSAINIRHVLTDENGRYSKDVDSCLNRCFNLEANIDQTGRALIQDLVMSMFDEGCVALVPTDVDYKQNDDRPYSKYDILTLRVGKIVDWYPKHVKVNLYNESTGLKEDILLEKKFVCIIENPLYSVINAPNSTMKRLIRKLSLLDYIDEQSSSGKLDLIIQLPYIVRSDAKRAEVSKRKKDLEEQLTDSKYGIGYIDSTEKIIQLNRPVENNLMGQIEYLTKMLYSQLGFSQSILDGTADEQTMLNYYNSTIEPILSAIVDNTKRSFLSEEAIQKKESIMYFRNPFKLVPVTQLAEISDKLTRNEIASSNEIRQIIGWKPSDDPRADELRNKNLNRSNEEQLAVNDENYKKEE